MTFDDWLNSQLPEIRSHLEPESLALQLCREAFEHGQVFGPETVFLVEAVTYEGSWVSGVALSRQKADKIVEEAVKKHGDKYTNHDVTEVELDKFLSE